MPPDASADPSSCPFMARLVDLLGEMPRGHDREQAAALEAHLDRLESAALRDDAPETTLAAIKGARVMLALVETPPIGPASSGEAS